MLQAVLDGQADAGFHRTGLWLHHGILGVSKLVKLDPPLSWFLMSTITLHPCHPSSSSPFRSCFWPCSLNGSVSRTFQSV
jgi:hypothetical protein